MGGVNFDRIEACLHRARGARRRAHPAAGGTPGCAGLRRRAREQVDKPEGAPAWMGDKAWKQQVKKVGIDKLEEV